MSLNECRCQFYMDSKFPQITTRPRLPKISSSTLEVITFRIRNLFLQHIMCVPVHHVHPDHTVNSVIRWADASGSFMRRIKCHRWERKRDSYAVRLCSGFGLVQFRSHSLPPPQFSLILSVATTNFIFFRILFFYMLSRCIVSLQNDKRKFALFQKFYACYIAHYMASIHFVAVFIVLMTLCRTLSLSIFRLLCLSINVSASGSMYLSRFTFPCQACSLNCRHYKIQLSTAEKRKK